MVVTRHRDETLRGRKASAAPHPHGSRRHWRIIENGTAFKVSREQDFCKLVVGVILRLWVQNTWMLVNYNYSSTMPELGGTRRNKNPDNPKWTRALRHRVRRHSHLSFLHLEFLPKDQCFLGLSLFDERGKPSRNMLFRGGHTRSSEHSGQGSSWLVE